MNFKNRSVDKRNVSQLLIISFSILNLLLYFTFDSNYIIVQNHQILSFAQKILSFASKILSFASKILSFASKMLSFYLAVL
jgi:hypothetical protein